MLADGGQPYRSPSTTTTVEAADLQESQLGVPILDPNQEREIRDIIGHKTIGSQLYDWLDWMPSWKRDSELDGARESIDKFVAQLQYTRRENWDRHGTAVCLKRGQQKIKGPDLVGNNVEPKKRGRPRKQ